MHNDGAGVLNLSLGFVFPSPLQLTFLDEDSFVPSCNFCSAFGPRDGWRRVQMQFSLVTA